MKKIFALFTLILLFAITINAQQVSFRAKEDYKDMYKVNVTFTADSAAAEFYSTKFSIDGYNQTLWSTYPITANYDLNTASGNPKIIIILYGVGANNKRYALDSLGVGTGVGDTLVSTTENKCRLGLEAGQYKFGEYQLGFRQIAVGKALTTSYVELTFIKPKTN